LRNSGSGRKVGDEMSLRLVAGKAGVLRAIVAAGCIGALVLALVLSVVPQLHEELHAVSGAANHECAVTLLTSGNYQHTPTVTMSVAPSRRPATFVHAFASFQLVSAHLSFSPLEHAPPAIS
jgi:predicted metal-binding membrane protein